MAALSNLDLLRRVPIFSALTPSQILLLANTVKKQHVKRGTLIVKQGQIGDALFVILQGQARVVISDQRGREVILATLVAGDYVGELSLIDGCAHSANVEAQTDTDMLVMGSAEFQVCLKTNITIAQAMIKGLAYRLRKADEQIMSLALMDVYDRVSSVLVNAAEHNDHELVIRNKITRQDIAKMVGATRETVSRVMRDFEDQGFVTIRPDGSLILADRRSMQGRGINKSEKSRQNISLHSALALP